MRFYRWKRGSTETTPSGVSPIFPLLHDAHAQLKLERYDLALAFLLRALEFRHEIEEAATIDYLLDSLGATWLLAEKFDEGIATLSEYINRYPNDPAAHHDLGALHWYSGHLEESIRDYSAALALRPNDILSRSGRGQVLAELGENQRAMEDLDSALRLLDVVPRTDPAWHKWYEDIEAFVRSGRAVVLSAIGESVLAMKEFERSIELCPNNAWVYFNRGRVFDNAYDPASAISDFGTALGKKHPPLNPLQRAHAEKRTRELQRQMGF